MLNGPPKKSTQNAQNPTFEIYNCLYNFGRDPSFEYAWFFFFGGEGANPLCTFRGDIVWSSPIWSYVNEKKMAKIQNLKIRQCFYNFGRDPP